MSREAAVQIIETEIDALGGRHLKRLGDDKHRVDFWDIPRAGVILITHYLNKDGAVVVLHRGRG